MKTQIINNGKQLLIITKREIVCPKCKGNAPMMCICNGTGKMELEEETIKDLNV
jgi:hypothetical protein